MAGFPFYVLGDFLQSKKKWADAEQAFRRAVKISPMHPLWNARIAAVLLHKKAYEEAIYFYDIATRLAPNKASWHYGRGKCLSELKRNAEAHDALYEAVRLAPNNPNYHARLAAIYRRQGKRWLECETLFKAIALKGDDPSWHFRLGESLYAMNRLKEAAIAFRTAASSKPKKFEYQYYLGLALEELGLAEDAETSYDAILQNNPEAKRFGIGVIHAKNGRWAKARDAYLKRVQEQQVDAELRYRAGMALDRCYEWSAAIEQYSSAIALDDKRPEWHYRLGFASERAERWHDAASAYQAAISLSAKHEPYWLYRLAACLTASNRYEEAVNAYLRTDPKFTPLDVASAETTHPLDQKNSTYSEALKAKALQIAAEAVNADPTRSIYHQKYSEVAEQLGDVERAVIAARNAIDREEEYSPSSYYRLGQTLAKSDRLAEACEAFSQTRIFQPPYGVDTAPYRKTAAAAAELEYCEFYETLPIRHNVILFESFHGKAINCNPRAILNAVMKDKRFNDFVFVLVVNDASAVARSYKDDHRVVIVGRGSHSYRRFLATAKYLINNNTFPPYFIRRKGQKYLNTWHGVPIKTLGKHIQTGFMEHKNASRNFIHATHMLSPNRHTTEALIDGYDIQGLFSGKIAETGYPRVDATVSPERGALEQLRTKLKLNLSKKTVLYAPTWRGDLHTKKFDTDKLAADLRKLSTLDCNILFRGHGESEALIRAAKLPVSPVPAEIDSNDLLAAVDLLITDYSSIAFDFMPLHRPIAFYGYDMEEYSEERGLIIPLETLTGTIYRNIDDLILAIKNETVSPPSQDVLAKYCPQEDGRAAERALAFFFDDDDCGVVDTGYGKKENILFYGGLFLTNGITASVTSLVNSIDKNAYNVAITFDTNVVGDHDDRRAKFSAISPEVRAISRQGSPIGTPEEKWLWNLFHRSHEIPSEAMWAIIRKYMRREFRRCYGETNYFAVVDFEGYGKFWASLLSLGPNEEASKLIFLHNNMEKEWKEKYPYLEGTFRVYKFYDHLISASESVNQSNREFLLRDFGAAKEAFDHCDNVVLPSNIIDRGKEPLSMELTSWAGESRLFVSVGRLMPEKDHRKLINAFAQIHARHPDTKLLILGEGPLHHDLQDQVAALKLDNSVLLPGAINNPMPAIKRANCLVLSSNYEGQGLVLIEAMVLGTPVISTDIAGPRSVLSGGYGLLVDNNEKALAAGMADFIEGKLNFMPFDGEAYKERCLKKFLHLAHSKHETNETIGAMAS